MKLMRIEDQIFGNLIGNDQYARKVVPFLSADYFTDRTDRVIFEEFQKYFSEYNSAPSKDILKIEVSNRKDVTEDQVKIANQILDSVDQSNLVNLDWITNSTEKFCKEKAVYNAILNSIRIIDGKDKNHSQDAIPDLLSKALAVTFDSHVGHDYLDDADARYDFYHRVEEKVPFNLEMLNKITNGGLSKKTLNIILAGTGVGKSLAMCHFAAANLMMGKNVLYITMEMAEERIAERIDANLLELTMDSLKMVEKRVFDSRIGKVRGKTEGKLIVKEYPTASAHAGHFRALIEELKMKRSFIPDIIYIDYLNICSSQRMKMGGSVNSYTYIKAIAEELRGLAGEYKVPLVSATQTTRGGFANSDPGLEDTSESFGLPATADLMLALIATEELDQMNQIMVKQLKNRYSDPNFYKRFVVGVDRKQMRLYDVEMSAQANISEQGTVDNDMPLFDQSKFGKRMKETNFEGFKV
jgi:replicative DNA helicase